MRPPRAERDTSQMLQSAAYIVTTQSDRMGYRLEGPVLESAATRTSFGLSEATFHGALQVPPNGQPIVLMADRQTTGGYPVLTYLRDSMTYVNAAFTGRSIFDLMRISVAATSMNSLATSILRCSMWWT